MENDNRISDLSDDYRNQLIDRFVTELPTLRAKLGLSQDELSNLIGMTRQTFSLLENRKRQMMWNTYLSLVLIFDSNPKTHSIIRNEKLFPERIVLDDNIPIDDKQQLLSLDVNLGSIFSELDEKAIHSIETMIMVEYARCHKMTGDEVIRAFEGMRFKNNTTQKDVSAQKALNRIKGRKKTHE